MPTKLPVRISNIGSQADRRTLATYYDHHKSARFQSGRPWWGYDEISADPQFRGGPVGSLTPGDHNDPMRSSWEAPWMPDAKYLRPDPTTRRLAIAYPAMIADFRLANEQYYAAVAVMAHEQKMPAPELHGPVDYRFRAVLGPPPQSPKIPEAAQAGDPWLLGFTEEKNDLLARILKVTAYGGTGVDLTPPTPQVTPSDVLTMSKDDLNALIAQAVAAAMAKPDPMQKARDAKAAKKQAQQQASTSQAEADAA